MTKGQLKDDVDSIVVTGLSRQPCPVDFPCVECFYLQGCVRSVLWVPWVLYLRPLYSELLVHYTEVL